ncbi:translesion DNA synthesis-associated protein ImuA [Piscinibacter sakaiensis]|uniref:translesion DNA synthesis-associated protein ImuA n=1 Tax=Piscinibacter sakaiensis TaxID=1547922 RepID=UPI003AB07845
MTPLPPITSAAPTSALAAAAPSGPVAARARPAQGAPARGAAAAGRAPPVPESLHPALWLGHQLGRQVDQPLASGFPQLDAELPGGGWPRRVLSELLLAHPGIGEIRLLAPSLVATQRGGRPVMLFDPPARLSAQGFAQLGFDLDQLLVVQTRTRVVPGADSLWALEQALKSGHVGAIVAWLPPRLRAERLRRLQLAAQAHDGPAFVMREPEASQRPTAAPLRLALRPGGADTLRLRLLKRRGPPLETTLQLDLPPVLSGSATQRARAGIATAGRVAAATGAAASTLHTATFINLERPAASR